MVKEFSIEECRELGKMRNELVSHFKDRKNELFKTLAYAKMTELETLYESLEAQELSSDFITEEIPTFQSWAETVRRRR